MKMGEKTDKGFTSTASGCLERLLYLIPPEWQSVLVHLTTPAPWASVTFREANSNHCCWLPSPNAHRTNLSWSRFWATSVLAVCTGSTLWSSWRL